MNTDMASITDTSYIGSKGKLLYRRAIRILVVLFIVLPIVVAAVNTLVLKRMTLDSIPAVAYIFAGIQTAFRMAAWLLILLPYGTNNRVNAFKIMFYIVAGAECIGAFSSFISAYGKSYTLYTQEFFSPMIHTISNVAGVLSMAAWIAFIMVVLCHHKTGRKLRKSSIVMLICYALGIAYRALFMSMIQTIQNQDIALLAGSIIIFSFAVAVLLFVSQIYFLRAMSFSEIKEGTGDSVMEKTV